jgi:hypothetical protein
MGTPSCSPSWWSRWRSWGRLRSDEMKALATGINFWLASATCSGSTTRNPPRRWTLRSNRQPRELRLLQTAIFRRQSESSLGGQTLMAALLESTKRDARYMKGYPARPRLLGQEGGRARVRPPGRGSLRRAPRDEIALPTPPGGDRILRASAPRPLPQVDRRERRSSSPWRLAVPNWRLAGGNAGTARVRARRTPRSRRSHGRGRTRHGERPRRGPSRSVPDSAVGPGAASNRAARVASRPAAVAPRARGLVASRMALGGSVRRRRRAGEEVGPDRLRHRSARDGRAVRTAP